MTVTNLTADDLKKLPLRAIVAFAARCARRVEHLAVLEVGHSEAARWNAGIAEAIRVAEDVARGLPCSTVDSGVREVEECRVFAPGDLARENAYAAVVRTVHAAACACHAIARREEPAQRRLASGGPPLNPLPPHLADLTADLAALGAFTAAMDAAEAVATSDDLTMWAARDYQALLSLRLGKYPEAGQPVDPSPAGPLGPLRPKAPEF